MKVEVSRRKRKPSQVFLPCAPPPVQLEPLGLEGTSFSDCTGDWDRQKVGSCVEESD